MTEPLYSFEKCKAEAQSTNSYGMNLNSEVQRSCRVAVKYMDVLHRQHWNKNIIKVGGCANFKNRSKEIHVAFFRNTYFVS